MKSWGLVISFDHEPFDSGKPAMQKKGDMIADRLLVRRDWNNFHENGN